MRLFGILITACVVLAAAQAIATALCILLLLAFIYGLFAAPRETFGLLGLLLAVGLIERHPLACLGLVALMAIARLARKR
jgi:quinol-cytochrome oxidoreductase complex cytochrome b subunit